jgi:hypothetical protein
MVLQSDLELHLCANGYVGLCRLRDGKTNVCGLFRRRKGEVDLAQGVVPRLRGEVGSILYGRLEAAEFEEDSLTAIGGLMLRPRQATGSTECCIGDSLTMIPPVTGNGMSIAFESAELALAPLLAYARGESQWEATREAVAGRCDVSFRRRLGWARWFQHVLLCAPAQRHLLPWIFKWDACWQLLFWATR